MQGQQKTRLAANRTFLHAGNGPGTYHSGPFGTATWSTHPVQPLFSRSKPLVLGVGEQMGIEFHSVAQCLCQRRPCGNLPQHAIGPCEEIQHSQPRQLPSLPAVIVRITGDAALDIVKLADGLQPFGGDGMRVGPVDITQLAPCTRPAGNRRYEPRLTVR